MPARRPRTVGTRDQIVSHAANTPESAERMLDELSRVLGNVESRVGRLDAKPTVSGSRASGAALVSLLDALAGLGLITDGTEA